MDVGILILRVVVGALFVAHGTQKLFGWFGGYGIKGTGGFMEQLGYRRGRVMATVAGLTETGAGLLLAAGFLVPLAAAGIIGMMINAILTAKRNAGLIGGYELDLALATAALALAFTGGGLYSIDAELGQALGWSLNGAWYGLGALALAIVASLITLGSRRPQPAAAEVVEDGRKAA